MFPHVTPFTRPAHLYVFLDGEDSSSSPLTPGSSSQSRLTVASIVASGRLPDPALGVIADIDTAIKVIAKNIHGRERICEYILSEVSQPAEFVEGVLC